VKFKGSSSYFHGRTQTFISLGILSAILFVSLLAPVLTDYLPDQVDLSQTRQPPSRQHYFGTDEKGRDIFSRVIYGARFSLGIGALATLLAVSLGSLAGLAAGYYGGRVDAVLQMITDITLAFPSLLLAIGISVVLTPGFTTVFIALGLVGWASVARLVRGEVLRLRESLYVEASRASGATSFRVLLRHILPNCLPIIVVAGSLKVGGFILGEAALSFLDLGVRPPDPAWGYMISASREYLKVAPWMAIFPGVFLALTVLAFNLLGDAMRDRMDPAFASKKNKA